MTAKKILTVAQARRREKHIEAINSLLGRVTALQADVQLLADNVYALQETELNTIEKCDYQDASTELYYCIDYLEQDVAGRLQDALNALENVDIEYPDEMPSKECPICGNEILAGEPKTGDAHTACVIDQ